MKITLAAPVLSLLALAGGGIGCGGEPARPAALGTPGGWVPLEEGRRWIYEVREGAQRTRIAYRVFGGDARDLDGVSDVPFQFVYGTPEGFDHEVAKSIYALPPGGPRLFYLDAMLWRVRFDPPLPLMPAQPHVGAVWEWFGSLTIDRKERPTRARIEIEALEQVVVPAGTFETLRVCQTNDPGTPRITSWYAQGVGLVRFELSEEHAGQEAVRMRLELLEYNSPTRK